jgi:polyhydroxyalkanoate synthesis regulator phasin
MEATREWPSGSLLSRVLQWWRDFETALERQPTDHLEMRVAELERRIADLTAASRPGRPRAEKEV